MAFTEYTEDTDIIASLPDDPNDSGGLTAAELKEKFDENSTKIVEFLNDTLIAELNSTTAGSSGADKVGYGGDIAVDNVADALDLIYAGGSGTIPPDNTITAAKLTTDAVITVKIQDEAVTPAKAADCAMPSLSPWELIEDYTTAGNYTFTAPDLYNGADYEIGAYIIGGGGSGGAAKALYNSSDARRASASGGGSGYTRVYKMTVSPTDTVAVVVGAGGTAVNSTTAYNGSSDGVAGGNSSFNSIVAAGGGAGKGMSNTTTTIYSSGAAGGQGSDYGSVPRAAAPALGENTLGNDSYSGGNCRYTDVFNPFDLVRRLAAGGSASGVSSETTPSASAQTAPAMEDGLLAGAAAATADADGTSNPTGGTPTSPGSGGGAAILTSSATTSTTTGKATSGAGADGAVFIYARKFAL